MSERCTRARAYLSSNHLPTSDMRPAASPRRFLEVAVFVVAFLGLLLHAAALPQLQASPLSSRRRQQSGGGGTAAREEKVRLGSSPPSCRGKCYECSPCAAVQVPTVSSAPPSWPAAAAVATARARLRARAAGARAVPFLAALSNYKPVGWKCQCRDRLFEP